MLVFGPNRPPPWQPDERGHVVAGGPVETCNHRTQRGAAHRTRGQAPPPADSSHADARSRGPAVAVSDSLLVQATLVPVDSRLAPTSGTTGTARPLGWPPAAVLPASAMGLLPPSAEARRGGQRRARQTGGTTDPGARLGPALATR